MKVTVTYSFYLLCLLSLLSCQKHDPAPTYAVTYDGNGSDGGTVPVDTKTYSNGSHVTVLDNTGNLVKLGYAFSNWNTKADGTGSTYTVGSTFNMSTTNVTLYANWTPPATAWTTSSLPGADVWFSVVFGGGRFVAISQSGVSAASTDGGKTWTAGRLPSGFWYPLTYGGNNFVAMTFEVPINSPIIAATSPNGISWTQTTPDPATNLDQNFTSIAYGNGLFVIVGQGSLCFVSSDGVTWQTGNFSRQSSYGYDAYITFGNNIFVAVTNNYVGASEATSASTYASTSSDGINWTIQTTLPSVSWQAITFGNNVFCAIDSGGKYTVTSADGINWTTQTLPATIGYLGALTFGNGAFVTIGYESTTVGTSTDGATWKLYQTLPGAFQWNSITYGNGSFVAIEPNGHVAISN